MTAAVPDPRFRDQLAEALYAHDWVWNEVHDERRCSCGAEAYDGMDEHRADALLPLIEARVQAAAKQRAAEDGRCGHQAPSITGGSPAICALPAGHAGWHRGDRDDYGTASEWGPAPADEEECEHHSWTGLMALLDEHWPDDICPTRYEDDPKRDAGARIVSLMRWIDRLRAAALASPAPGNRALDAS